MTDVTVQRETGVPTTSCFCGTELAAEAEGICPRCKKPVETASAGFAREKGTDV